MLKTLYISGFKSFSSEQKVPLAPLTLIYGPNSAGKTSVIQTLLFLKQSLSPTLNRGHYPVFRGELVDLGSFQSAVHRHDRKRDIVLAVEFQSDDYASRAMPYGVNRSGRITNNFLRFVFSAGKDGAGSNRAKGRKADDSPSGHLSSIEFRFRPWQSRGQRDGAAAPDQVSISLFNKANKLDRSSLREVSDDKALKHSFAFQNKSMALRYHELVSRVYDNSDELEYNKRQIRRYEGQLVIQQKRLNRESDTKRKELILNQIKRYAEQIGSLKKETAGVRKKDIVAAVRSMEFICRGIMPSYAEYKGEADQNYRLLRQMAGPASPISMATGGAVQLFSALSYLGPLRAPPERHYSSTSTGSQSVGKSGENTPAIVYGMGDRLVNSVNKWFEKFEINYTLKPKSLGDEIVGHLFSLNLRDRTSNVEIGSSDVGFGVGQLMPILVEGLSSAGKTILVEQPEIHLHPKLQGHLADFFAQTSGIMDLAPETQSGSDAVPTNQWIVETHSEALISRLQRRIREGKVAASSVSILYVRPGMESGAHIDVLRLDSNGDFVDEWPEGFFEERLADLLV